MKVTKVRQFLVREWGGNFRG